MKKVISLFLALLMAFSVVTVAFATSEKVEVPVIDTGASVEDVIDLGEYQWILDLPFWTVGPALKFAEIAVKLIAVYLKVAKIFGVVDEDLGDMILGAVKDLIESSMNSEESAGEVVTTAAQVA